VISLSHVSFFKRHPVARNHHRRIRHKDKPPQLLTRFLPSTVHFPHPITVASKKQSATAKLSTILLPRTVSYTADTKRPPRPQHPNSNQSGLGGPAPIDAMNSAANANGQTRSRRRRSSSIIYKEPAESAEQLSDQAVLPNINATWVNAKGTSNTTSMMRMRPHGEDEDEDALLYRTVFADV